MIAPRNILVLKWRAMGDTVLLTSPLTALRDAFPRARIDACVSAPWAPLLQGHPALTDILPFERRDSRRARLRSLMRLGVEMRARRYDAVLCFHASPSSAAIALATGAKTRAVHFHGHTDRNRGSTVEIPGKGVLKPILERDLDVVRALGVEIPAGKYWPRIFLTPEEREDSRRALEGSGLVGPVLALGLGASRATKQWPLERFAEIAQRWVRERGGSALALVAPEEAALAVRWREAVLARSPEAALRIGIESGLGVRALAARLTQARAFIGNDSGPKHLAVAVGVPTLTLFGPEDPFEWHPYPAAQHSHLFVQNLACRKDGLPGYPAWCGLSDCVVEKHRCMQELSVDQAWTALQGLGAAS